MKVKIEDGGLKEKNKETKAREDNVRERKLIKALPGRNKE